MRINIGQRVKVKHFNIRGEAVSERYLQRRRRVKVLLDTGKYIEFGEDALEIEEPLEALAALSRL